MNKRQFKKHPFLTRKNIKRWKKELEKVAEPFFGPDFSKSVTNKEWLESYSDTTPYDAVLDNVAYSL